ncbi:MAG: MFS transporter [Neisseriaceae bacterium]|nr:MFS transporter [Neisseriaceae bacterium]
MSYRHQVALIFLIGFFIDCINIFMSAIALPDIAADMAVSPAWVTWVTNAYILGLTVIMPLAPWLAARYGARRLLTAAMLIFSVAVALCGLSQSFYGLVWWRFVQGVGGGLLIPVGQALTFSLFQGSKRSQISTVVMAVALLAPALSPSIGGAIVDHASWRWVFFSNVPFSLLAAGLAWRWLRPEAASTVARPDVKGLALIGLGLALLLWALSLYGDQGEAAWALAVLAMSLILLWAYCRHERRQPEQAILALRLLRNRPLRASIWVYYAIPGIFTGVNVLAIFYLQQHLGFSAEATGRFMFVYAVGALAAMLIGGRCYVRVGPRRLFSLGIVVHNVGIASLFWVASKADMGWLLWAYALMGIGGGLCANTAQTTALIDFEGADMAKGSVIWNINRQVSFSIGVALLTMILGVLSQRLAPAQAYQYTFLIAAMLGSLSLLAVAKLTQARMMVCTLK